MNSPMNNEVTPMVKTRLTANDQSNILSASALISTDCIAIMAKMKNRITKVTMYTVI